MGLVLLTLASVCLACALVHAQTAAPAGESVGSKTSDPAKPELQDVKPEHSSAESSLSLKEVGPLTPEEAARTAAKRLAKSTNGGMGGGIEGNDRTRNTQPVPRRDPSADQVNPAPDNALMEFHPSDSGPEGPSTAAVAARGTPRKGPLKRVHGDLYGARSGTGHTDGGSLGATSKNGKTSVYVESD